MLLSKRLMMAPAAAGEEVVNLLTNVDISTWSLLNATITSGQSDPDGGTNGFLLTSDQSYSNHTVSAPVVTEDGLTYTLTITCKPIDSTYLGYHRWIGQRDLDINFDMATETATVIVGSSASVTNLGGGWYELTATWTTLAATSSAHDSDVSLKLSDTKSGDARSVVLFKPILTSL